MTNHRHLRKRFRHARRSRLGRVSLLSAAVSAAAVGALPVSQAMSATAGAHPERTAVVDLSAAQGATQARGLPSANPAAAGATPAAAKSGPGPASTKSPERPATTKSPNATAGAKPAAPARLELRYKYGVQINGWYCGPAATQIALTARGVYQSQEALAAKLGTTVNGTNSSADIVRVLNAVTKTSFYHATFLPSKSVTAQQVDRLRSDVVDAISHGYAAVMNVVGSGRDTNGRVYSFPGGHYITAVGYRDGGRAVKIADPANGYTASYWMTVGNLAQWVGARGYAA